MEVKEKEILLEIANKALSGRDLIVYKARLRGKSQNHIASTIERSPESVRLIVNDCIDQLKEYIELMGRVEKLSIMRDDLETKTRVMEEALGKYDINPKAVLSEPLSEFNFSVRCTNVLRGLFPGGKVLDLARAMNRKGPEYFLAQKRCGVGTVNEINDFLVEKGVRYQLWD